MPEPRHYQTEAIIIRKTRLKEADRILTLFTPHRGKIQGVAKGVRRPRSKLTGHLELLTYSLVSLARGRGNLDTITGSQTIASFLPLKKDLRLSAYALYVIELVNQFTADRSENQPLFQLLVDTLKRLCQEDNSELAVRYFEMRLLTAAGYQPQLHACVSCKVALEAQTNYFSPPAGGMLCPACRATQPLSYALSVNAQKVLRFLQENGYEAVSKLSLEAGLAGEVEGVLRQYLRYLLEREVKSLEWLDMVRSKPLTARPCEDYFSG
ncbi:MAG: DNA repair protein RecO [Chloroflexota bacterium]